MSGPTGPVLSVEEVTISFSGRAGDGTARDQTVVSGVGFELRPGRVLAIVGESGSGKSVTAMSILGLLPPSARVSGRIVLEGRELLSAPPDQLRDVRGGRIGTVFQEPMTAFDPVYTIERQIAEAITAHASRTPRAELRARVQALLRSVGIEDAVRVARSYPHELSGGQLQRAMIAMAISSDPVALIADEPTTALDVTVQAGILDLLRQLCEERGTAVLLITHDMGVVADIADDVVVMREGEIVEHASVANLFANPQHDYTRALLAAVPQLDAARERVLEDSGSVSGPGRRSSGSATVLPPVPVAALEGASVQYRKHGKHFTAVDDVSLAIQAGEIVGLVGESGSGKSTIGRALIGLTPLSSGSARIADVEVATGSARAKRKVRSRVGYVFQDPASSLNPRFTIEQCIAEPLRLHTKMTAVARHGRVIELLDAVRVSSALVGRYQHELSGGQRQRVAIARGIALHPDLLIADEPTSALDVSVQAAVLELLRELQHEFGFACLFISHDLAVVSELADTVAVMRDGRILERGPTEQVLHSPHEEYTKNLLAAVPVADPDIQRARRLEWRKLTAS